MSATRTLTHEQKRKMQEGAALYREAKQTHDEQRVLDYCSWVRDEAAAYARYAGLRDLFGYDDPNAAEARKVWQDLLDLMPETPADSSPAWRLAA